MYIALQLITATFCLMIASLSTTNNFRSYVVFNLLPLVLSILWFIIGLKQVVELYF